MTKQTGVIGGHIIIAYVGRQLMNTGFQLPAVLSYIDPSVTVTDFSFRVCYFPS